MVRIGGVRWAQVRPDGVRQVLLVLAGVRRGMVRPGKEWRSGGEIRRFFFIQAGIRMPVVQIVVVAVLRPETLLRETDIYH